MKQNKKLMECSEAIAEAVMLCKPGVIASYPITPQTHIVEKLAELIEKTKNNIQYLNVESEHSAMSACIGAQATGVRTFTASSSQGIALMHEMLFIASGLRLPIVMAVANRALSAPINIWNDQSDTIAERDSGWIQFYCESVQEAYDTIFQAYKVSEAKEVMLPSMVCVDGFVLSHVSESLNTIRQKKAESFLPWYRPQFTLSPEKPLTMGPIVGPQHYMHFKQQQEDAMKNALKEIVKVNNEFKKKFKRGYGNGLVEIINPKAKKFFVAMGSVCSTIKDVLQERKDIGLLRIKTFRPFPSSQLKFLEKKEVGVIDKAVSPGSAAPLFTEIKSILQNKKISSFVAGLGGKDIKKIHIEQAIKNIGKRSLWLF